MILKVCSSSAIVSVCLILTACVIPPPHSAGTGAAQPQKVACQPSAPTGSRIVDRTCSEPTNVEKLGGSSLEHQMHQTDQGVGFGGNR